MEQGEAGEGEAGGEAVEDEEVVTDLHSDKGTVCALLDIRSGDEPPSTPALSALEEAEAGRV